MYIAANCTSNIGVVYVCCWFLGMGLIGRFTFGFVMMTELTPNKQQAIVGTILLAADAAATLYITFFIAFISSNVNILVWVGLALNILACTGGFFLVESPAWLNTFGDKQKAIKTIKYIAKFNGAEDFQIIDLKNEKFEIIDP